MGGELFGIDIMLVREIIHNFEYTSVDHAPEYVCGLMNLRGRIVTIVDLSARFGIKKGDGKSVDRHCVVLKTAGELKGSVPSETQTKMPDDLVGILIDNVDEVHPVEDSDTEPPPANMRGMDSRFLKSVVKLDKRLMVVLNVPESVSVN